MDPLRRNNVHVHGTGTQPMMFANGYGCDQAMWRHVWPAFGDRYKIVLFDHVGSGGADNTAWDRRKYGTLDGYATDILEIIEALDLRDVILVAHSVSTMTGIIAAVRQPDRFARLVLVGPSPRYVDDGGYVGGFERADIDQLLDFVDSNYLGWTATVAPLLINDTSRPDLAKELENAWCRNDPAIMKHFARVTFLSDNRADLGRVRTPSLVIQCRHDNIAPVTVGEYVHRSLANSELVVLEAHGHCPHLSDPDLTVRAIEAYLRQQASAPGIEART